MGILFNKEKRESRRKEEQNAKWEKKKEKENRKGPAMNISEETKGIRKGKVGKEEMVENRKWGAQGRKHKT
jgi:hypothetical protein